MDRRKVWPHLGVLVPSGPAKFGLPSRARHQVINCGVISDALEFFVPTILISFGPQHSTRYLQRSSLPSGTK